MSFITQPSICAQCKSNYAPMTIECCIDCLVRNSPIYRNAVAELHDKTEALREIMKQGVTQVPNAECIIAYNVLGKYHGHELESEDPNGL